MLRLIGFGDRFIYRFFIIFPHDIAIIRNTESHAIIINTFPRLTLQCLAPRDDFLMRRVLRIEQLKVHLERVTLVLGKPTEQICHGAIEH